MPEPPITIHQSPITDPEDEISLLDILIVLAKHKKLLLGLPAVAAVASAVYALSLPNIYTATTRILPPSQQSSSASGAMAQMGVLAAWMGGAVKNPNDTYIGMLKSRTVADNLIQRFDLNKVYRQKYQSGTRKQLQGVTTIIAGRDGIISIDVDDKDPKLAAEIANAYVDELFKLTTVLAVTEASQRRLFFERQINLAREGLVKAETAAKQALEQGGLIMVEIQGRTAVETAARLRAEITVKEVQIGAMRMFAAEGNPELRRAREEVEVMKRELARSEGMSGKEAAAPPRGKTSGIDNLGLLRNVRYYETMYELLAKEYEIAKLDEARDSSIVQVMDKAIEPDRKSKPVRSQIVQLSTFVAGLVALVCVFVLEAMEKSNSDPRNSDRWRVLKETISLRGWRRNRGI